MMLSPPSADFVQLSRLLDSLYPPLSAADHDTTTPETNTRHAAAPRVVRPRVQGPDACFGALTEDAPCATLGYLRALLAAANGTIDDITVHNYGLTGPKQGRADQCDVANFLDPSVWEANLAPALKQWRALQKEVAPRSNLVLSETATAADGGCHGISNSFAAGFYFVDVLGLAGTLGYWQVYRQDLVGFSGIGGGSSYALAGNPGWYSQAQGGKLTPNPDYYTARLWRRVMGARRLDMDVTVAAAAEGGSKERAGLGGSGKDLGETAVRAHASCAVGGGVAVAFANPTKAHLRVVLGDGDGDGDDGDVEVEVYTMTAPGGNLTSRTVELNGASPPLQDPADALPFARVKLSALSLPPMSYGFFVHRGLRAAACSAVAAAINSKGAVWTMAGGQRHTPPVQQEEEDRGGGATEATTLKAEAAPSCLGEFVACGGSNDCVLVEEHCGRCKAGEYLCPSDQHTCVASAEAYTTCPGLAGTHLDVSLPIKSRLDYLVKHTNVTIQAAQLTNTAPAIPQLGVPAYQWLNDDQHGVARTVARATVFPNGCALGATWSTTTLRNVGEAIGNEARGLHNGFLHNGTTNGPPGTDPRQPQCNGCGITLYAPNINLVSTANTRLEVRSGSVAF